MPRRHLVCCLEVAPTPSSTHFPGFSRPGTSPWVRGTTTRLKAPRGVYCVTKTNHTPGTPQHSSGQGLALCLSGSCLLLGWELKSHKPHKATSSHQHNFFKKTNHVPGDSRKILRLHGQTVEHTESKKVPFVRPLHPPYTEMVSSTAHSLFCLLKPITQKALSSFTTIQKVIMAAMECHIWKRF